MNQVRSARGAAARLRGLGGEALAVVEVKQRRTLHEALKALRADQRERLGRAGAHIAARRPALQNTAVRLDLITLARGRAPRHIPDAWAEA